MRGRLSGCCPSDLVKQVYFSSGKLKASSGSTVLSSHPNVAQASGDQLRGKNCFVEVTLGFPGSGNKGMRSNPNFSRNVQSHHLTESLERDDQKNGVPDYFRVSERTFIYPAEAVIVPVMQTAYARSSLKRFWLQNLAGASLFGSCFLVNCSGLGTTGNGDSLSRSWIESNGIQSQHNSNNTNSSSNSSISSTSSDSDYQMTSGSGDLEADADSLTCRQSGFASNDQLDGDDHKQVSKRPRTGTTESFGGSGTVINPNMEANNSSIVGVGNDQVASLWDWDSEVRVKIDIQLLISDFGDFSDFFENEALPFGEV